MSVFDYKKAVVFVGDGSGAAAIASGYTKTKWDERVAAIGAEAARDLLMDVNGFPIVEEDACDYTFSDQQIDISGVAAMGVIVGMCAYIYNATNGIDDGIYEITTVSTNYIICANMSDTGIDCEVDVIVGGEFFIQDALDETTASAYSVDIHVRDALVLSATSIDVTIGGGSNTRNTFKRILGYNTAPGDMDLGGFYHESPIDILKADSIDSTKTVTLDGNNDNVSIFTVGVDNIIIENFHLTNTGTTNSLIHSGTPQNVVFRNCRFSIGVFVSQAIISSMLFDSCYSDDSLTGNHYQLGDNACIVLNCVGKVAATKFFVVVATIEGSQIIGCIAVNGTRGVRIFGNDAVVSNNTFYNQTVYGIDLFSATRCISYNNIFYLYPGAKAFGITLGSVVYSDYNCFRESDNTDLTFAEHLSGYEVPIIGAHSIEVDPQFMDAANFDFRLKTTSPCLNTGRPNPDNSYINMGAWQRISRIRR